MKSPSVEQAALSLEDFACGIMPGLQMSGFHRVYYKVLEMFALRKIRRLIVTIPPQHGKSLGSSQILPAYMLGLDPELRIAIASYSGTLANRFNKRVQRIIDSQEYKGLFPGTSIKSSGRSSDHVRTAAQVEIIGHSGELMSVGREGSLTGNRVDVFILDDLYKDAMEANSPVVRENCWDWYVSVVRTRMHNDSSELIVFTRWHNEDLIGMISEKEKVMELTDMGQLDGLPEEVWVRLNFEALKESEQTPLDPRPQGEALWPERHSVKMLSDKRRLDPHRFRTMYQGRPSASEGLLYSDNFHTYDIIPGDILRWGNYTDTADTGDDYLCSVCYAVDSAGKIYVTDVVYSREPMEITEKMIARMLSANPQCEVLVESNNGGRGFARAVGRYLPGQPVAWFHQTGNKEARIMTNASSVLHNIAMPADWHSRWPEFAIHITTYLRRFRLNRWHDAPDVLTGIVERELSDTFKKKIRALSWSRG